MSIKKPMLAVAVEDTAKLEYPVLATPKLDGIRCLIVNGQAVSRKLKPIPNHHIRKALSIMGLDLFDGEIMIPGKTFNEVQSLVMTEEGEPEFEYWVFDWYSERGYKDRMERLKESTSYVTYPSFVKFLFPTVIDTEQQLLKYEQEQLAKGYEGVMLRAPNGGYKFGRSTLNQGWLLKLKRFSDSEAVVIGFEEKLHNDNEATIDELGHTKRSSHKVNLRPAGTLGTLLVKDTKTGIEFGIGTGFDDVTKLQIWNNQKKYLGKLVTYQYQAAGMLDKPRFPSFKGFRHADDTSE